MGIAANMNDITENIVASHDVRVKAMGDLVTDTQQTLKRFAKDRRRMGEEQAKRLANFVADLSKNVGNMIKGFQKEHDEMTANLDEMADNLKEGLAYGEAGRLKTYTNMMGDIRKGIKDIETYVNNKLKEFSDAHAEMSEQQKKDLAKYVRGIVIEVKKLLGEYAADMAKAKVAWRRMSISLAKSRKGGVRPKIEAEEKVTTVEKATKKPEGKGGKKKGGGKSKIE